MIKQQHEHSIFNVSVVKLSMYLPINRCGHLLLRSELQGVDDTEQLVEVPSRGGRVEDGQLQLLVGADHKHLRWDTATRLRRGAT